MGDPATGTLPGAPPRPAPTTDRVHGLDAARGLAVLGMFTAHVGDESEEFFSPTGWLQVADGRSAATFALLAGVSAALLSGGRRPRASLRRDRTRIVVRAVALAVLGVLMIALGTPVAVILPGYALMFCVLTVALRWSRPVLVGAAAVVALVGPPVVQSLRATGWPSTSLTGMLLAGEYYPALVWLAYLLVGLAIGRSDLRSPRVRGVLAGVGAAALVLGYGTAAVGVRVVEDPRLRALLTSEPHADTTTEVVGNIGVVLLVLVACLVLADRARWLVVPVAATGALALTAYCGHLVAIAVLGDGVVRDASNVTLALFIGITLAATTAWRLLVGRGPLEAALHGVSTGIADAVAPAAGPPAPPPGHRPAGWPPPPGPPPPPPPPV